MSRHSALLAGFVATFGAVASAVTYLAGNSWFGTGDIWTMLLWSLPLGFMLTGVTRLLSPWLTTAGALTRYAVLLPVGGLLGVVWSFFAALLLGGWIGAFSFPVFFCWVAGGLLGGLAAAWEGRRSSWPAAVLLATAVVVALLRLNAYAQAPEPRVRVVVKAGAANEEVQQVWTHVLGRPTGRPGEHSMLEGLSSVSASGLEGESAVLTVSFWKSLSQRERDSLVALIQQSPLVLRVDRVSSTDTSGVRPSVSY